MSKKPKKSKKTKKLDFDTAYDIGFKAEQVMAQDICAQTAGDDNESVDAAFIGAFKGIAERMLRFWEPMFLAELIESVINETQEPHVWPDCQETHGDTPVVMAEADKSKVH